MTDTLDIEYRRLGPHDLGNHDLTSFREMMTLFADAFDDEETYLGTPRDDAQVKTLLARDSYVALVATIDAKTVGALSAYVLDKPERNGAELYIYDLAVAAPYRRRGIATGLINALKPITHAADGSVIFVQADYEDPPAIALYESLGEREDVLHFDILPR